MSKWDYPRISLSTNEDLQKLTLGRKSHYEPFNDSSYDPPINFAHSIDYHLENNVYKAILNVGVVVDKDELLKALDYDRGQYEKGYKDGYHKGCVDCCKCTVPVRHNGYWMPHRGDDYKCSNCGFENDHTPLYCEKCGTIMNGGTK